MIDRDMLIGAFARNLRIIRAQAEGLSHEDALVQTEHNINCLNWVIGHIVDGRDGMLRRIGADGVLDGDAGRRYRKESEPVVADGPDVISLTALLSALELSQTQIAQRVATMSDDDLAVEVEGWDMTAREYLFFQYFHDTYHTGQTELLRQVSGKSDSII